jgi:GAF domain/ANTAR domain
MGDESTADHGEQPGDDAVPERDQAAAPGSSGMHSTGALFTGVAATCETAARLTGVDGAAVAVLSPQSVVRELLHATDALAQQLDELQFTVGEGPCLDAHRLNHPELHGDLLANDTAAQRWPVFTAEVVELGVQAVFAFPVPGPTRPVAVLELYRVSPGGLSDHEHDAATMCAATIGATLQQNWHVQLASVPTPAAAIDAAAAAGADPHHPADPFTRTQIHVAAGMIAVQLGVTAAEALDRLRAYSFSQHRSITAIAAEVIERRVSFRDQRHDPTER